jgi:PAS domain S-box-containing protein
MKSQPEITEDLLRQISRLSQRVAELEACQEGNKRVEHALVQSELRFRTLAQKSLVGIYLVQDKSFRYVNPKFAQIFGYAVDELIDVKDMHTLVHEDDLPLFKENIRKRLSGEIEAVQYQFRGRRKDGSVIHVEVYGSRMDFDGRPAIIGSLVDITRTVEAEKELRRSESLYRSLIDTMGESFGMQDTTGVITYVNDRMCELWGYSREELIGHSVMEFVNDVNQRSLVTQLGQRKDGVQTAYEIEWKGQGGRTIPTKVSPKFIFDDEGNYAGSFAVITDLTELKAAHEALETEKMKFEILCENLPFGVVLIGIKGEFLYTNPAFRLIAGYPIDDITCGREWFSFAFPDPTLRAEAIAAWKKDSQSSEVGKARPRTFPVRCRDGTEKIIHFRPVQLEDGGHLMTCEDITGRIEKERVLQEREKRFRTVFQKGPLGMVLLGLDLTWIAFNDRYVEMLGYEVDELKRISVLDLTHPEDVDAAIEYFRKLQSGESETCNYQKRYVKKDGETIWAEVTDSIIRDDDGDGLYYLGMVEDITDRKLKTDQIEESLREKEVLLREIHHRVKNNLQVISSLFRLQSRYSGDKRLDQILQESQSRIEAISLVHEQLYQSNELSRIDIAKYFDSLMAKLAALHGVKRGQIVTKVDRGIHMTIDSALPVGLIAHELVTNALKHSARWKSEARVTIAFSAHDETCELLISDRGPGLPINLDPENPYTMGLRLVQILAKQLQGKMSIKKRGGSEFKITFRPHACATPPPLDVPRTNIVQSNPHWAPF